MDGIILPAGLVGPLFGWIAKEVSYYLGMRRAHVLSGANEIAFISATIENVTQKNPIDGTVHPEEDKWVYVMLQGSDQEALTDALLRGLDRVLGARELTYASYREYRIPSGHTELPSALWATHLVHDKNYLVTCKQCGRTVLTTRQGPERKFCSDTCRALYSKNIKTPFLR